MTVRSTRTAAAIAAGITVLAASAGAGEARAFEAWGHRFTATDARVVRSTGALAGLSTAPRPAYTSALARAARPTGARAAPTLNVWGARIEAPAD